tara:strand:- start:49 stop:783 length:735 start_codon:yes stop_codon:yes gene_type:complete
MGKTEIVQVIVNVRKLANVYSTNRPFPYIILKNIWDENQLSAVADECENFTDWDEEKKFFGSVGKRSCSTFSKLPKNTLSLINFCHSSTFLNSLEILTGEVGLIPDPHLYGGGIHSTVNKGFLKMHVDFDWHARLRLRRRLNLLIYLNRDWRSSWGGALRLQGGGESDLVEIFPNFNKTVIFTTDDKSLHGHPEPMNLPGGRSRNSIALYYYVAENCDRLESRKREMTQYFHADGSRYPDLKVQ